MPEPRGDVGVLPVHGIGDHKEGETLTGVGEPRQPDSVSRHPPPVFGRVMRRLSCGQVASRRAYGLFASSGWSGGSEASFAVIARLRPY
jgi:hypothetical protein